MRGIPHTPETVLALATRVGPCLEWQGTRSPTGYGLVSYRGRWWRAHRLAWELARGPIPVGLAVCHTCDNPPCIELLHLFLGTRQQNMIDARAKGRMRRFWGADNPAAKLTPEAVEQIRALAVDGMSRRAIARWFGVSHQQVTRIVNRERWSRPTSASR